MNRIKIDKIILQTLLILIFVTSIFKTKAQDEKPDSVLKEQIHFIQSTLETDRVKTKRWWYGWIGIYGSATIGQGIVYFNSSDKSTRQDMALGAATNLIGVVGQFITPLKPGDEFEKLKAFQENTSELMVQKSEYAEKMLNDVALREKEARSWKSHVLVGSVNIASGLITWLGFKRTFWAGLGNFAMNTAITEVQIWTQPTWAMKKYKLYRQRYILSNPEAAKLPMTRYYFTASAGGFHLKVVF